MQKIEVYDTEADIINNIADRHGVTTQQVIEAVFDVINDEYLMDVVHEYCEGL